MSTTIVWIITAIYLALWLFCFIHCIRNRNIYRPFNCHSIVVKLFWIAFLFTFSPFAFAAYLIFGLAMKHKENRPIFVHPLALGLIIVCVFLAWPQRSQQDRAVRMVRSDTEWREISDNEMESDTPLDVSLKAKMHLGVITARTTANTTTHSSHGGYDKLSARRIAITVDNDHPLLQESADLLVEALKEISYVENIEYLPFGYKRTPGSVLPDVWIRLSVPHISVVHIPPQLKIKTTIVMSMTAEPFDSVHSYHESYSVPTVDYGMSCELYHDSTTTVIGTGNTKYQLAAKEIAEELIEPVKKLFADYSEKYGLMPREIDRFLPAAKPLPELPIQALNDRKPYIDGLSSLVQNSAYWIFNASGNLDAVFESFIPEMESDGWQTQQHSKHENSPPYIRFSKDRERLIAFAPKDDRPFEYRFRNEEEDNKYIIAYKRYLPLETVMNELRTIIPENPSVEFLMTMKDWIWQDKELRRELLRVLENSKDNRPDIILEIASLFRSLNEHEKQWMALQKARALENLTGSEQSQKSNIDNAIKKFKKEHRELAVDVALPELYESLGAYPWPNEESTAFSQTAGLNEPLAVYRIGNDGNVETIAAFMIPTPFKNSKSPYALRLRHCKNGNSMTTSGEQPIPGTPDAFKWECNSSEEGMEFNAMSRTAGEDIFSIELKIEHR